MLMADTKFYRAFIKSKLKGSSTSCRWGSLNVFSKDRAQHHAKCVEQPCPHKVGVRPQTWPHLIFMSSILPKEEIQKQIHLLEIKGQSLQSMVANTNVRIRPSAPQTSFVSLDGDADVQHHWNQPFRNFSFLLCVHKFQLCQIFQM